MIIVGTWITICFTFAAAIAWGISAVVRMPKSLAITADDGGGPSSRLGRLSTALKRQSLANAFGAIFATVAAISQACTQVASTMQPQPLNLSSSVHAPAPAASDPLEAMMARLGISELLPPRSSEPTGPNPANYDEAKANPYPNLPDLFT